MPDLLLRRLKTVAELSGEDEAWVTRLCAKPQARKAGEVIVQQGERPRSLFMLADGWACHSVTLSNERRQIISYLVPGDICDVHVFDLEVVDFALRTLSDASLVSVSREQLAETATRYPQVAWGLRRLTAISGATLRQWLANLGMRDAYERLAHLFCEMWFRLEAVGLTHGGTFDLPVTQEQLSEMTGLTPVHVNRVLQRMRREGLIALATRSLAIHDLEALRRIAEFDGSYLRTTAPVSSDA